MGGGTNEQNITDYLRRIFISDPGYKFAYSDLERAESLCVAYLARDEGYIAAHKSHDLHAMVAAWVFGIDESKAKEQFGATKFSYRDIAKRCANATNYNATPQGRRANRRIDISLVREAPEPT